MADQIDSKADLGLVVPAALPFDDMKAKDLEECVYWLLDAMGARDLEWRTGGTGGGAADGGRDLEATFYQPTPDGEMEPQRWWIECKGRSRTVESDAVKSAVHTAAALPGLAYVVVVTNAAFSNPTRDWVKTWQIGHPTPRVKLWDRTTLVRLLSRQPRVVSRLFAQALSPEGRLAAVRDRFWNSLEYSPIASLKEFWVTRDVLPIAPLDRFALIANEIAHGSISERPWATQAEREQLLETLSIGLVNAAYLLVRASTVGIAQEPLINALAHVILAVLQDTPADALGPYILESIGSRNGKRLPDHVIEMLLLPILDRIATELQDVCSSDCRRISRSPSRLAVGAAAEDPIDTYWARFSKMPTATTDEPNKVLLIESHSEPCKVGFQLDADNGCPLFAMEPGLSNIVEFLHALKTVASVRREIKKLDEAFFEE